MSSQNRSLLGRNFLGAVLLIATSILMIQTEANAQVSIIGRIHDAVPRIIRDLRPPTFSREEYLGATGLVSKHRTEVREIYVGGRRGEFTGLRMIARDDDFKIQGLTIYFADGGRQRLGGIELSEGRDAFIDLTMRDRWGLRGRLIDVIIVEGQSMNLFGSKAQLEVYGARLR